MSVLIRQLGKADGSVSPGVLAGKVLQRPHYFIKSPSALVAWLRWHRLLGATLIMGHERIHSERHLLEGSAFGDSGRFVSSAMRLASVLSRVLPLSVLSGGQSS